MKPLFQIVSAIFFTAAFAAPQAHAAEPAHENANAYFAAGCFWCAEHDFEQVPGVISVTSGYTGGQEPNPTYHQVSAGVTGHAESVQVTYDPTKVSYEKLLDVFWHNVDPLAMDSQFCDQGHQYRSAIFYSSPQEKALAEQTKAQVQAKLGQKVMTEIVPAGKFWPAEEYHQHYATKNPIRYKFYRTSCGRDRRLKELRAKLDSK